jgi:hypothetical protein
MRRREQANQKSLVDLQRTVDRLRDHNRRLQDDNARLRRIVRAVEAHVYPKCSSTWQRNGDTVDCCLQAGHPPPHSNVQGQRWLDE